MATKQEKALLAEIAKLRAENETIKQTQQKALSFRVSAKGALSVYGLGRFPVTLYKEQWQALFGRLTDLQQFLTDNDTQLKAKGE